MQKTELVKQNEQVVSQISAMNIADLESEIRALYRKDMKNVPKRNLSERANVLKLKAQKFIKEKMPKSRTQLTQRLDRAKVLISEYEKIEVEKQSFV